MSSEPALPEFGETPTWHNALAGLTKNLTKAWKNQGWTWTAGGCFAFAEVFAETFDGEEYGICSFEPDEQDEVNGGDYPVEHAVVKVGDAYYDYKGRLDIVAEMAALEASTGRRMFLKAKTDPAVFWFEDDFLDDADFEELRRGLSACVPGQVVTAFL